MRLHDAARRFNDTQAYDGYTGQRAFLCHYSAFDDHSADGATARRRALNIRPQDVIPTRRVLRILDERWLVGAGTPDAFAGTAIRQHYGMKKATDLATLATPAQTCAGSGGTQAYVHKHYYKDTVNSLTDAKIDTFWNVFIAPGEPVVPGTFIDCGDVLLRARNTYLPVEGLLVAQCDQLDAANVVTLAFASNGAYDPVNDSFTAAATSVSALVLEWPQAYRQRTQADPAQQPGDLLMLVAQTALTPLAGAEFTYAGSTWRVLSVQAELDAWQMHVRRG